MLDRPHGGGPPRPGARGSARQVEWKEEQTLRPPRELGGLRTKPSRECEGRGVGRAPGIDRAKCLSPSQRSSKQNMTFPNGNSYVGTCVDGRMHGEGLYVWRDGSEYTGEFINGRVSGLGERRWSCGRRYRGEWRQDMMWGEGAMTWPTGESYTGQFRKGAFHGRGTRVLPSGDTYEGGFNDGEQEGDGTFRSSIEGWVFVGFFVHGRMYGEGRIDWPDGRIYVGQWKDGIREGHGKLTWPDGSSYEGPFRQNRVEGHGRKFFPDGAWFEGQFSAGEFDGNGLFHWPDGTEFEGLWRQSEIVGPGCHRFPSGTSIEGTFEECGASGEGTKRWPNGCVYSGILIQNRIVQSGTLRWPDGRCYVGCFEDDAMHGEGTLSWTDDGGRLCSYQGQFERNAFQGRGTLDWSTGSHYEGTFTDGLYHGEGTFEWPGKQSIYRGQWVLGEMCGKGTLTCGRSCSADTDGSYVYAGNFRRGHMEGRGRVRFLLPSGEVDRYWGEFRASKFNGLGTFSWASGASLTGLFEDNYCNRVGRKLYPDGRIYTGELRFDLEHGKGVQIGCVSSKFIGRWQNGEIVESLIGSAEPELDLALNPCDNDDDDDERGGDVTDGSTGCNGSVGKPLLPVGDATGTLVDGKAIVAYLNGDRYVGSMRGGRKHGRGMYVYADLKMYRGTWVDDLLDGVRHPVTEDPLPIEVKLLHRNNKDEAFDFGYSPCQQRAQAVARRDALMRTSVGELSDCTASDREWVSPLGTETAPSPRAPRGTLVGPRHCSVELEADDDTLP